MSIPTTIIVHTGKCGGTSLRFALSKALGPELIREDYGHGMSNPAAAPNIDPVGYWANLPKQAFTGVAMGHFHISRYDYVEKALRVALIRHPVDRIVSLYHFWRHHSMIEDRNPLRLSVQRGDLDLDAFAQVPLVKGVYRNVYFRDVDMRRFDLLIVYERIDRGVEALSKLLDITIDLPKANRTEELWPHYPQAKAEILADRTQSERLAAALREEVEFYQACVALPNAA